MGASGGPNNVGDGLIFTADALNKQCWQYNTPSSGSCYSLIEPCTGSLINDVSGSLGPQGSWAFDGTDDYIELSTVSNMRPSEADLDATGFTVTAWINSDNNSLYQGVFCNDGSNQSTYYGLEVNISSTGYLSMHKMDGTGAGAGDRRSATSNAQITVNTWAHVTWDFGSADHNDWKIYKNAVEGSLSLSGTGGAVAYSSNKGAIGLNRTSDFDGEIALVRVYNRSLTQTEVTQNYNAQKSRFGL